MTKTIVDLHTHLTDAIHQGTWYYGKPYVSQKRTESLAKQVLEKSFSIGDSTVMGIIDFDDHRAQHTFDAIKRITKNTEQKGTLLTVTQGDATAHYMRGQEVPTDKGHIVVLGSPTDIHCRKLEDALKEAHDCGGIVIADHPLFNVSRLQQAALELIKHPSRLSLTERELFEFRRFFDAMEIWNGNLNETYSQQQEQASFAYNIPGIAVSDSHSINGIFSVAMEMDSLDFTTDHALKDSLRDAFKKHPKVMMGSYAGLLERLRHTGISFYENTLVSAGLVKKE